MIYLDSGATTLQKPPFVASAMVRAMRTCASPGRGGYPAAMRAAEAVYDCRQLAAGLFDAQPEQVVFTMNATHALNIAIRSLVSAGDVVVVSGFEHNVVMRPLYDIGARVTIAGRKLFDQNDTLRAFSRAITPDTRAVICTHVSNVFGYILPVDEIAAICRQRGVPLIVDASQSAGILPVSLQKWSAAYIAMPGHKSLYGPQGTGILLCGQLPKPLMCGGSGSMSVSHEMPDFLPDRAEAGTHNVCGICGLAAGLQFVMQRGTGAILSHEILLRRALCAQLQKAEKITIYTKNTAQTGVLSLAVRGKDCEQTAAWLAEHGMAVRAGLHCAPLAHESAGTLESGTVRVSFSALNTMEEAERAALLLKKYLQETDFAPMRTCTSADDGV